MPRKFLGMGLIEIIRFALANLAAFVTAVGIQMILLLCQMGPAHFRIDLSQLSLLTQHIIIFAPEPLVGFGGIFVAGFVLAPRQRATMCWVIMGVCLLAALWIDLNFLALHMKITESLWDRELRNPFLWCFAVGGIVGSLYFTLRKTPGKLISSP